MGRTHVFQQLLTPVADSLGLYFIAARLPILTVLVRTFQHSVILTLIFGLLVALQQYVIPWIIPVVPGQ